MIKQYILMKVLIKRVFTLIKYYISHQYGSPLQVLSLLLKHALFFYSNTFSSTLLLLKLPGGVGVSLVFSLSQFCMLNTENSCFYSFILT